MVLRDARYCPSVCCYAMCGAALAYAATIASRLPTRTLCGARYRHSVCCYARATRCPVLTLGSGTTGRALSYGALWPRLSRQRPRDLPPYAYELCAVRYWDSVWCYQPARISLHVSAYARTMPCPVRRYSRDIILRARYGMSGTDLHAR
eukprot:223394-Rhodomonas_salina.4